MTRLLNDEVGKALGCDYSTSSRIRNGDRLPSLILFARMHGVYGVDANDALDALLRSRDAFTQHLNEHVFDPKADTLLPIPSLTTFAKMVDELGLDAGEALQALRKSRKAFTAYVSTHEPAKKAS